VSTISRRPQELFHFGALLWSFVKGVEEVIVRKSELGLYIVLRYVGSPGELRRLTTRLPRRYEGVQFRQSAVLQCARPYGLFRVYRWAEVIVAVL
jgi:hypothetical protein